MGNYNTDALSKLFKNESYIAVDNYIGHYIYESDEDQIGLKVILDFSNLEEFGSLRLTHNKLPDDLLNIDIKYWTEIKADHEKIEIYMEAAHPFLRVFLKPHIRIERSDSLRE